MRRVDANIILRYILKDNELQFGKACSIMEETEVFIAPEVMAEVVYVLLKVYQVPKKELCEILKMLLMYDNVSTLESEVMRKALVLFSQKSLDFVDCILCAYHQVKGDLIETFDQRLLKSLKQKTAE